MSIKSILEEEFESELGEVSKMEVGSEKCKTGLDGALKIADRIIEIEKLEADFKRQDESREIETALKQQQLRDEKKDRVTKNWISVGVPAATLLVTGLTFIGSTNFEKTGHIISTEAGRSALKALLRFKV
jgi:hypothetical protein